MNRNYITVMYINIKTIKIKIIVHILCKKKVNIYRNAENILRHIINKCKICGGHSHSQMYYFISAAFYYNSTSFPSTYVLFI